MPVDLVRCVVAWPVSCTSPKVRLDPEQKHPTKAVGRHCRQKSSVRRKATARRSQSIGDSSIRACLSGERLHQLFHLGACAFLISPQSGALRADNSVFESTSRARSRLEDRNQTKRSGPHGKAAIGGDHLIEANCPPPLASLPRQSFERAACQQNLTAFLECTSHLISPPLCGNNLKNATKRRGEGGKVKLALIISPHAITASRCSRDGRFFFSSSLSLATHPLIQTISGAQRNFRQGA